MSVIKRKVCTSFSLLVLLLLTTFMFVSCGASGGGGGGAGVSSVSSPAPEDPTNNCFKFTTSDAINTQNYGADYRGVTIFYKIYSNQSTLNADVGDIIASINANNISTACSKLITTYQYQPLCNEITIPQSSSNQSVLIRLFAETSYPAVITYGTQSKIPTRYYDISSGTNTFQFSSSYYPVVSDLDFKGSVTTSGPWYVAAFAASTTVSSSNPTTNDYNPKYIGMVKVYY